LIKATTKDEVHTKEKCRIFYVNNIALTWMIRKYYLPIIRFLQMHPTLSECAVGVNAESKEWEQLDKFMRKYDRLIGGDYSKYDQKIPTQLILTAFRILVDLASLCNYTDEDLLTMQTMIADVVYAYIMFNGDLIALTAGTHISGNSLTVIINGIVGALNLRNAFYHYNPKIKDYRKYCAIMTYGDDNAGSVSKKVKFGIKSVSEFLAIYGQTYTMPDKESKLVEELPEDKWEFLKRKTVFIPEINCRVGALSEASMIKDLYMHIPSKNNELCPMDQMAVNIDGVVRNAFFHGRKRYDYWKGKMLDLAIEAGLENKCRLIHQPFETRVHEWKLRYVPEYQAAHGIDAEEQLLFSAIGVSVR